MNNKVGFWESYWADKNRLAFQAMIGLVIFSLVYICFNNVIAFSFALGFTTADPLSYYLFVYKKFNNQ
jgi:hypothetical protein